MDRREHERRDADELVSIERRNGAPGDQRRCSDLKVVRADDLPRGSEGRPDARMYPRLGETERDHGNVREDTLDELARARATTGSRARSTPCRSSDTEIAAIATGSSPNSVR